MPGLSERRMPQKRREGFTYSLHVGGVHVHVTLNYYPDGSLCEFFCNVGKGDAALRNAFDVAARMGSIALQRGAPTQEIVAQLRKTGGYDSGVIHCPGTPIHGQLATSSWDALAQLIEAET